MEPTGRKTDSVGASIGVWCAVALIASVPIPGALNLFLVVLLVGALLGLLTSPAAAFALARPECRPSFGWVYVPTAIVAYMGALVDGPGAAIVGSVATYGVLCVVSGVVAMARSKHLDWYYSNRCPGCGYSMSGLSEPRCPECGRNTAIKPRWRGPVGRMRP